MHKASKRAPRRLPAISTLASSQRGICPRRTRLKAAQLHQLTALHHNRTCGRRHLCQSHQPRKTQSHPRRGHDRHLEVKKTSTNSPFPAMPTHHISTCYMLKARQSLARRENLPRLANFLQQTL
ncbi:hypothetical protein BD779DRAFT_262252 [Infundibulicybe gibba]|nr:hypothetical protein BD779DRAFT_262252 [Infundibulicybe gibba]